MWPFHIGDTGPISRRSESRRSEPLGELRMVKLPYLVAPGEDPGIYRRACARVRLWNGASAEERSHAAALGEVRPTLIGEILRPREGAETFPSRSSPRSSSRKTGIKDADDERFPNTELVAVDNPMVSANVGVASGEVNRATRYFRFVDLTIQAGNSVIAETLLRPESLGTNDIEHTFSDLVYLSRRGAFLVLDCSEIDPASVSSFSRGWIPRLVQQLTDRHQRTLPILGASPEVQNILSGLSDKLAFCDSLAKASNVF